MKHVTMASATLICVCFFINTYAQTKGTPYKADYSSDFKLGNPAYADVVLNIWKDWDDNELKRHDYFADTITIWMPDGSVTRGKANNLEMAMKYRSSMTSSKSTIHAWVPLYSIDKKDNFVCVWGSEEDTFADGKVEKKALHEVWWFNKDGKVTTMRQWNSKFGE